MKRRTISIITSIMFISLFIIGCNNTPAEPGVSGSSGNLSPPPPTTTNHFLNILFQSDLIVLGTITDKKYDLVTIESGNSSGFRPYTIFTLSVEKVIKGETDTDEVFIRVPGGPIGEVFQQPTEGYFPESTRMLVLLFHNDNGFYTIPHHGITWFESIDPKAKSVISLDDSLGNIIALMKNNNIPISLPPSEWPPLPAEPILPPDQTVI
jgi:hypothetical protein